MKYDIISDKINFKAKTCKNICLLAFYCHKHKSIGCLLGHSGNLSSFGLNKYDTVKVPLAENQCVIYK